MPVGIDMSDAFGPENTDTFDVIRREQDVNKWGEAENGETVIRDQIGVVDAGSDNKITIATDQQHFDKTISIVTQFKLRGTTRKGSKEFAPDLVFWNGDFFKVIVCEDYSRYGFGFIQAQCGSIDYIETAPADSAGRKLLTDC